ncbi:MAG: MASE3 domain-containing protein [bacterium]
MREHGSRDRGNSLVNGWEFLVFILLLAGITATRLYNYLLFHSLAELFSIVIAVSLFLIVWNTRESIQNKSLLFLGIAYFFVALIDLVHTLAYKGMGVFPEFTANLPTQLWIGARYLESLSLLLAPLFLEHSFEPRQVMLVYSLAVALLFLSIFLFNIFPACYVEGKGLTPFKIASEYIISGILLLSMFLYLRKRGGFPKESLRLIELSILFTVFSEIAFTQYVGVYEFANMLGHIFKVISFYLIYLAIVSTGLRRPLDLLWRALKESEEKYRTLVEGMNEGVAILDSQENFIYANPKAEEVFGVTPGQLEGRSLLEFIPPEELPKLEEQSSRRRAGMKDRYELEILGKDGKRKTLSVSVSPLRDSQGNFSGACGVFEDITIKKAREREIERLAAIINAVNEAFLLFDQEGKILTWNKRAVELFPLRNQDQRLNSYPELFSLQSKEEALMQFEEVTKGKGHSRFESQVKTRGDSNMPAWVTLFPIPLSEEKKREIGALIVDLTERKKAEELHADFIRSLIHDLSNPITASLTAIELISREKSESSSFKDYLEIISLNLQRIASLISNFSRALNWPSNGAKLEKTPQNLHQVLSKIVEAQRPLFARKKIELSFKSEGQDFIILAHENLERAIGNILDNALKFTPEGGRVEVSLKKEGGEALIRICDSGTGIPPHDLPHIFERFYKGRGTHTGTGLGLYTAKLTIEDLKGEISVESEVGKGSKFTISLPLFSKSSG